MAMIGREGGQVDYKQRSKLRSQGELTDEIGEDVTRYQTRVSKVSSLADSYRGEIDREGDRKASLMHENATATEALVRERLERTAALEARIKELEAEHSTAAKAAALQSETERAALQSEKGAAVQELTKIQAESARELESVQTERTQERAALEGQLASSAAEHERSSIALKAQASALEEELSRARQTSTDQAAGLDAQARKMTAALDEAQSNLAERETELAAVAVKSTKTTADLQGKLKVLATESEASSAEHDRIVKKLYADLRQRSSDLDIAQAENETMLHELGTKVEAGEAEAAALLRVELNSTQQRAEHLEVELEQQVSKTQEQEQLLAVAMAEFAQMGSDLKRIIAQKDATTDALLEDKDAEKMQLQAQLDEWRSKANTHSDAQASVISEMQMDLAEAQRSHSASIEEEQERGRRVQAELATATSMAGAKVAEATECQVRVEQSEAALEAVKSKLQNLEVVYKAKAEGQERAAGNLKLSLGEDAAGFKASLQDAEAHTVALRGQILDLESLARESDRIHNDAMDALTKQWQERITLVMEEAGSQSIATLAA